MPGSGFSELGSGPGSTQGEPSPKGHPGRVVMLAGNQVFETEINVKSIAMAWETVHMFLNKLSFRPLRMVQK